MATDTGEILERAYPIRTGCAAMGCAVLFLVSLGAAGVAGMPAGCEKVQNGQGWELALGWLIVVLCGLALPTLLLAPVLLYVAVVDARRPQFLRITTTALQLPPRLQGVRPTDEKGEPLPDAPTPQPEEIPFSAIQWIRREDGVGGSQLLLVHNLRPTTLVISQYIMQAADFEELERILRAALSAAFAAAPPQTPPPT